METETMSIRELKSMAGASPHAAAVHAQVESVVLKTAKSGKPFYEIKLVDAMESMVLRAWNDSPVFNSVAGLKPGTFVAASGSWTQNNFGIDAQDWKLRGLREDEVDALLRGDAALKELQAKDWEYIESEVAKIADPRLHAVCAKFLNNFGERFQRTGAARDYHHARRGGLVEHVARMMQSAVALAGVYDYLNRDLLVAGVLFHDCGKLWENCYAEKGFAMPYTEISELISHIPLGMEVVNKLWREIMESDEATAWQTLDPPGDQVRLHLLHLIGSHHGEHEFGAPVLPKTPEAIVLHHIDNVDAKLEMMARGYRSSAQLAPNVFDNVRPLRQKLVRPLPIHVPEVVEDVGDAPGEVMGGE